MEQDLMIGAHFHQLGVLFVGILITRTLLFGIYIRATDFWQLPCKKQRSRCPFVVALACWQTAACKGDTQSRGLWADCQCAKLQANDIVGGFTEGLN